MEEGEGSSSAMVGEELEIVFFDVETSMPWGPGERRTLLEFGAILLCPRQLVEVARPFVTLVRPTDLGVVTEALERKGITRDALEYAPPFCDIADNIHDVLHGRIWAGHNIDLFDSKIIREAFAEIGRSPPEPKWMIDTLPLLTQTFGRRAGNMKMANLADYFHLGPQIHRSLDDVRMNLDVLKCCSTVLFLEENFPEVLGGFLEPNDISLEFIQVSVSLSSCLDKRNITSSLRTNSHSYQFERSFCIRHNDSPLQLRCIGLRVHYGVHPNYQDSEGRPKLSIVVDIPENLRELLEFCDEITEITSQKFGSTSTWCHVIKEYGNRPTVRLNIPTTVSGDDATYPTEIYLKEASGNIRKKDFSKVDVAELEFLFLPGDMVDAFFSVELYDYKNAGIRLVAKKLVVHCR
uniref:Exonuclease domain-containing protein n=1 Tax=Oryza punctata TaxID=4537 RepID=A0A0E0M7J9_ORYPU